MKSKRTHGSPYDRGGADSYYGRRFEPHYWPEGTNKGTKIDREDMTKSEIEEYAKGWQVNEDLGYHKDWG